MNMIWFKENVILRFKINQIIWKIKIDDQVL